MRKLRYLDFFAGIGGFHSAFERVGWECVGFCEIDKFARQSYKAIHNVEGAKEWHDITAATDEEFASLRGQVDVIAGGFPCQAFSVAGKRGGFEDSRGTLFFEVARAAKAIKPKYLVLENVKGLLSHDKGNTVDVILRTLNELGYTVDFEVLNTKFFGVPQNRERIFIVAVRDDLVAQEAWDIKGTGIVAKAKKRFSGATGVKSFNFFGWASAYDVVGSSMAHHLESGVADKYYLGDEKLSKWVPFSKRYGNHSLGGVAVLEKTAELKPDQTHVLGNLHHWGMDVMNRVYGTDGQAPTIHTMQGGSREPKILDPETGRIRKVTPLECWRLQDFTDEQFVKARAAGVSDSQLYKQAGNSVTVKVVEVIAHNLAALDARLR